MADRERLWQASWKKGERKGNMKLLYAEDEPAMSEAVTDILTFHKYMVDAVDNGKDALEYARSADSLVISAWGYDAEADANSVRVYLSGLRKKLAELGSHTEIVSRRNIGYTLSFK